MSTQVNFESAKITSMNKWFPGTHLSSDNQRYDFVIMSKWTQLDGWEVESIEWETEAPINSEEIEEIILEKFLDKIFDN